VCFVCVLLYVFVCFMCIWAKCLKKIDVGDDDNFLTDFCNLSQARGAEVHLTRVHHIPVKEFL